METLARVDKKIATFQPPPIAPFHPIIPPSPTDLFTGRGDYLRCIRDSFDFPKTSVEMKIQRRFVLYGTGGMGKTQLALKFLEENCEK